MKPIDARTEHFILTEIDEKYVALFTNMRLNRDTIPDDLYCYDVRDDCGDGSFAQIQPHVLVDFWGCILTKEPIPLDPQWHCYYPDNDAFYYPYSSLTMEEFRTTPTEDLIKQCSEPPNLDKLLKDAKARSSNPPTVSDPSKDEPTR